MTELAHILHRNGRDSVRAISPGCLSPHQVNRTGMPHLTVIEAHADHNMLKAPGRANDLALSAHFVQNGIESIAHLLGSQERAIREIAARLRTTEQIVWRWATIGILKARDRQRWVEMIEYMEDQMADRRYLQQGFHPAAVKAADRACSLPSQSTLEPSTLDLVEGLRAEVKRGASQRELARRIGCCRNTLNAWIAGTCRPTAIHAQQIASYLEHRRAHQTQERSGSWVFARIAATGA